MKPRKHPRGRRSLFDQRLKDQLNSKHPLYKLSEAIPWEYFEEEFEKYYSDRGRPGKPIRLMVGLLILKYVRNLSDERLVEEWVENPYYQYFCGEEYFKWDKPCDSSELVYFRKRIGEEGVKKIFEVSIRIHGEKVLKEKEIIIDSTVQEKNITYPTDAKLYKKICEKCVKIGKKEGIKLRQSYNRTIKELMKAQRYRNKGKNKKKAEKSERKLKTIAGRLLRELRRKLSEEAAKRYAKEFEIFEKVLNQGKKSKDKIYSLHEPEVYCIGKGKEKKKYEYGTKVSIALTKLSGIIVGALNHEKNIHDSKTLEGVLGQVNELTGNVPKITICDRGYRGVKKIGETEILTPKSKEKEATEYKKRKARERFRKRAGIEGVIGHLKSEFRLVRNYLRGVIGDIINVMLAAAGFNFKKWMRKVEEFLFFYFFLLFLNRNKRKLILICN